jgi:mannose-6-phosphate isomerase-like protein (cupin superfamily)
MSQTDHPLPNPGERDLSTEPESSRAWWFLGTLAVLRNPRGAPTCPTIIELTVPPGGSPPRHVHDTLDDNFLLLDGEVVVRCGERTFMARPGTYVTLPHGVDHTFRVTSPVPARMLLLHASDEFLRFIEAAGTPTHERRLPPAGEHDVSQDVLIRLAAEHDVRIIGVPLANDETRRLVEPA